MTNRTIPPARIDSATTTDYRHRTASATSIAGAKYPSAGRRRIGMSAIFSPFTSALPFTFEKRCINARAMVRKAPAS
jgi:hypothetical protein